MTTGTTAQQAWEPRKWVRSYGRRFRAQVEWHPGSNAQQIYRWKITSAGGGQEFAEEMAPTPEAAFAAVDRWFATLLADVSSVD